MIIPRLDIANATPLELSNLYSAYLLFRLDILALRLCEAKQIPATIENAEALLNEADDEDLDAFIKFALTADGYIHSLH